MIIDWNTKMQFDMFGAESNVVNESSSKILAFNAALKRGGLKDALAILYQLKITAAAQVLIDSGFSNFSLDNHDKMVSDVLTDIASAAHFKMTGAEWKAANSSDINTSESSLNNEEINHNGRTTTQSKSLPDGNSFNDRQNGTISSVSSESLDVGVANSRGNLISEGSLSELSGNTSGSGEGYSSERSEFKAPITQGNSSDVRGEGSSPTDRADRRLEFQNWFNGSKVVGINGKPLIVYHGTNADFTNFDFTKAKDGAHFFTINENHAASFGNTRSFYIDIKNPMVINQDSLDAAWDIEHPDGEQDNRTLLPRDFVKSFVEQAKSAGHDGLIIENMSDRDIQADMYLPFSANQIKLTSDFDLKDNEIVVPVTQTDYVLTEDDRIGLGGLAVKFQDNLKAISIVKSLDIERRNATPEERRALVRYVGWGGLKGVFDPDNKQWGKQHAALRSLLSETEWSAASRSQLDAFYTPPVVAKAMFSAATKLGFQHGRTLEPSVGIGNFFGLMPEEMRQKSTLHGVELDVLTSEIVSALYPSAKIAKATGFQSYKVPAGYYDMVIGNPPFGSQAITDNSGSTYSGWSIHNYFFAKSIEMLRPGGIMPMVVSHSFLDKLDPHVRQWISHRAELVSGVRLPNTAFKENANTEVITDVLIFRRLDDSQMLGKQDTPDWLTTSEINIENPKTGEIEAITVNNYFINNPDNVLGTQSTESSAFRANEYTVVPNGNLEDQLTAWVDSLPTNIYTPIERTFTDLENSAVSVPDDVKEGSFYTQDGLVYRRISDAFGERRAEAWEAPNQKALERMIGMINIRDVLRKQMWLERSGEAHDIEIEAGRSALNKSYNIFQKQYGFLNDPLNRRIFIDDTESALIQALEFDYEKAITPAKAEEYGIDPRPARATKADIMHRRVLFPPAEIVNVESAKDALLHSLNMTGKVDFDYMQRTYEKDKSAIIEELGDVIFLDPSEGWVTADAYLSGDVKTKLATAIKSAQSDPAFTRNISALEGVIPKDKLPSEIFASIGAAWIPSDIYSAFAKEISGGDINYSYMGAAAQWLSSNQSGMDYGKNNTEFGTDKMGAAEILFQTMNSKGLEVKKRIEVDGHVQYITDEDATEAVRQQGDKVRAHWDSWLWNDGQRTDRLTKLYNEKFNRIVERKYDGSHLSFPGMNPAISLLQHQKDGVWRGLQDRVMLADQVVGAGKTFELATMAMEMRRLGIAKKPMFVVPNHLTLQWRSEFYRLYPGANVLAATPQDFDKENRERLFSKIVTGNWDAVIIGHSSLKKLQVPLEAEVAIIKEQFDDMSQAIIAMKLERGDRNIIRDMEKIQANLEAKIDKLKEKGGKKDNVVDFADLGVDALFVDEMHEFKNLFFTTQMNRVAGLGNPAGSGKAFDLFVKVRWLQETFGEKAPLITATGTPVSNSLSEMFTMQRYMQYNDLKRDGLHMFDAWAKQYGDVQTVYEVAPSGTGYRLSQRFAKFKNLGSLMGSYRSFADVITLDDLKAQEIAQGKIFPVPKIAGGKPQNIVAQRSELQEKFFGVPEIVKDDAGNILFEVDLSKPVFLEKQDDGKWLLKTENKSKSYETQEEAAYALAVQATTPRMTIDPESIVGQCDNLRELTRKTKGKINALSLTGLANKAGLDYRIIDAQAQDFEGSKINLAIENMIKTYQHWDADKGVQLAFCDLSVPLSAKAKMANNEKRIYVRDSSGDITHKKGTLHAPKDYEGLPYYLVSDGKGHSRTFTMYDPITGVILKEGFDNKADAHAFVMDFITKEGGQEQWLDMRERMRPIGVDEIDDYKNNRSLDNDGDASDFEISAQDIEGVTGVTGFSVYDDMKAKLIAAGIPPTEIEFIHDHDTPQAKDALFKRVNAGQVRFLFGSTPKMGAGTNVQKLLVAEHHIDAPWRPSDLEQREGRIIRRGNELYERDPDGFTVEIYRYATAQTYDTRRWQLLEHKAAGVDQLRNYNGDNEIDDVASEASNSADMKAAASGNPLILKETQLATEIKKLTALSRSHLDGEYAIRSRMNSSKNYAETFGPGLILDLKTMMTQRDSSPALAIFEGRKLFEKEEVQAAMEKIATSMLAMAEKKSIIYRGSKFEFEKTFIREVTMTMPDGNHHKMEALSPTGSITRMENYVGGIESRISDIENKISASADDAIKMANLLGKPFSRAGELAATIAEHGKVQRALMKANSTAAVKPEEKNAFDAAVKIQKNQLRNMGFENAVREIEIGDVVDTPSTASSKSLITDNNLGEIKLTPIEAYHIFKKNLASMEKQRSQKALDVSARLELRTEKRDQYVKKIMNQKPLAPEGVLASFKREIHENDMKVWERQIKRAESLKNAGIARTNNVAAQALPANSKKWSINILKLRDPDLYTLAAEGQKQVIELRQQPAKENVPIKR